MFWNNGQEFKKLYGQVDTVGQTVIVQTPNVGVFQIRSQLRAAGAVFDASNVYSRVITPNGDGLNDTFIVGYDPGPNSVTPSGRIYDLRGAVVSEMKPGLVPNTIVWDGRRNGRAVTSGVYVYQIKGDGKTFNGTVVVGR
jgi:gliding motility-associated-like protein